MNWKNFMAECRLVGTWLNDNYGKSQEYRGMLIKVIAAILIEEHQPANILGWAISCQPLRKIICNREQIHPVLSIPDTIVKIILHWILILPRDPAILGTIYEKLSARRRFRGLYYTPSDAVEFILQHTLEQEDIVVRPRIRVLDPACGCGNFLLKAYEILFIKYKTSRHLLQAMYPQEIWTDEGIHNHILQYNLWGADIDEKAADIAAISLMLKYPNCYKMAPHILVCDSLRRPEKTNSQGLLHDFWFSGYDYVIGNPPYVSFGIRGTRKLDHQYEIYLRRAYRESAQYKLSYYVLFLQRGIEMLAEGGKLGFILPDSFLLGRYYSKIRCYILEKTIIDLIVHIRCNVFKNAATGYLTICIFTKCSETVSKLNHQLTIYQVSQQSDLKELKPVCQYSQFYFSQLPHNRFRILFDLQTKNLVDRIDKLGIPLKCFATGHTGIRSISQQKEIISNEPQEAATWKRGLVSGKQVCRFSIEYQQHWIHIAPELLYKGGWQKEIVQQRKLLIRQTGYMLIAAIDNNGLYHLNNIHSFILNQHEVTLDYLLLLLNSKLLSFYYHAVTMEYGRPMAQTDIETLELLPIVVNQNINHQAQDLVKAMESLTVSSRSNGNVPRNKTKTFAEYLDQIVYRIYGLTEKEIQFIEAIEAK